MTFEFSHLLPIFAFLLALYGAIRTELLRKQGVDAKLREQFDALENRVTIAELRLAPLFTVMDRRLAEMFHQHEDTWRIDRLLEKYQRDRQHLTDDELNRLIEGIYAAYNRHKRGGPEEDPTQALAATLYLGMLDGERNVRRLTAAQAQAAATAPTKDAWWRRLLTYLYGSN